MILANELTVTLHVMSMTLGHLATATHLEKSCQSSYQCSKTAANPKCGQYGNRGIRRYRYSGYGYVQNATVECVKQECVHHFHLQRQPCSWTECVDPLVCKRCPALRPNYVSEKQDCDKSVFKGTYILTRRQTKADKFMFTVQSGGGV